MLREISVDILGNEGVGDVDGVGHQKYPSCFFFSIDASPPSLSMMRPRSEEHTSELQSLMRNSYAVFCLKNITPYHTTHGNHGSNRPRYTQIRKAPHHNTVPNHIRVRHL